jgi:hypothetical protein
MIDMEVFPSAMVSAIIIQTGAEMCDFVSLVALYRR